MSTSAPGRGRHGAAGGVAWRSSARRVAVFLASLLSLTLLVGFGYGWYEYRSLNHGLQRFHLSNLAGGGASAPKVSRAKGVNGTAMNILVTGLDSRAGLSQAEKDMLGVGNDDSLATDTILVIHVPADGSKATLISLPRDSYVDVPGYLKNKLNAAYADGYSYASGTTKQRQAAGADLLVGTVTRLTGLRIDHYVQVGFGGFYTIAKIVGNIPVNLCQSTIDTGAYDLAHGEGQVGSGFEMTAGQHWLTPLQALEFVRQRHNLPNGDLDREARQRYFLTMAFKQIESAGTLLNPSKLNALIKAVDGTIFVDDGLNLQTLADQMINLSAGNITGYTIPTQGSATVSIAGAQSDVLNVDPTQVQAFVARILNPAPAPARPATGTPAHAASSSSSPAAKPAPSRPANCIN